MAIVIKKRVSFDFLGEEYKDAYIVFQSIPLADFDAMSKEVEQAEKENKAASFMLTILEKYFIEGSFPGIEKLGKEDLNGLDAESVIKCFSTFTGQNPDPKAPALSKTQSSTTEAGQ